MLGGRAKGAGGGNHQALPVPAPSLGARRPPRPSAPRPKDCRAVGSPAPVGTRWVRGYAQPIGGHGGIGSPAALTKSMLRKIRTTQASPTALTAVTSESEASDSDELNAREDSVSTDRLEDISQQHPHHRPQLDHSALLRGAANPREDLDRQFVLPDGMATKRRSSHVEHP